VAALRSWSWRARALGLAAAAAVIAVALAPAVRRGPSFHDYADERPWLGLPNAADVLSNLPFVAVGLAGLILVPRIATHLRAGAARVFAALIAVGLGSAAYHVEPTDLTLVLDWLPIVLVLAWLVALVLTDRVGARAGRIAAWSLPAAAVAAVMVWWLGGGTRGGDMRWYVGLQVSLVVAVPAIALVFSPRPPRPFRPVGGLATRELLIAVACFVAARAATAGDRALLDRVGVSGHTLKHLIAALASACVLLALRRGARRADLQT